MTTLGSSSLFHAPGVVRWARETYRAGDRSQRRRMLTVLMGGWGLSFDKALAILETDDSALEFDGDLVHFRD